MTNIQFYHKNEHQKENVEIFKRWAFHHGLSLFQPDVRSPWHVQARIGQYSLYPQTLNFWPHKLKGYYEGVGTVEGAGELTWMLFEALAAADDEVNLIDDE